MAILGGGGLSAVGRGLFRKGGGVQTTFTWLPDWEHKTMDAVRPSGAQIARAVHGVMTSAMGEVSRTQAGGGVDQLKDGWDVGVGSPPVSHLYWHLLEFGGGLHYARAPIRNAMMRVQGRFEPVGK